MYSVEEPDGYQEYYNEDGTEASIGISILQIQRFNRVIKQLDRTWSIVKDKLSIVAKYDINGTNDLMTYIYRFFISTHRDDINYYNTKKMDLVYKNKKLKKIKSTIYSL